MPQPASRYRALPVVLAVCGVVGTLGAFARLPRPAPGEVARLAERFRFAWQRLPPTPMPPGGAVFGINQTATHMQFYFYQIGASAALGDLDGDGLPNDLCLTDPRTKTVTVMPVPGTGARYAPFVLDAGPLVDRVTEHPSVCRIADMNEDGLADVFVAYWGRPPLLFLRRAPADLKPGAPLSLASFKVVELVAHAEGQRWWTATATFADVDGDGHQDIVIGNYYPDGAELTDARSDRPFEMNDSFSRARNGGTSRVFLYTGSESGPEPAVRYRDAGPVFPNGGSHAWTLAVGAADLDHDGLSDLYIANDFGPDQLLWNRSRPGHVKLVELHGESGFLRPTSMVIGQDSFKGMGVDFGDVNGDGIFDMCVSNIASDFALQESHFLWASTGRLERMAAGVAPWVDRADELGVAHSAWAWDCKFEDFDNDGVLELVQATGLVKGEVNRWPDLAQVGAGNDVFTKYQRSWPRFLVGSDVDGSYPSPFWAMGSEGRFVDLAAAVLPGLPTPSRGIAIADVDGDGDPDMVFANFREDSVFVENRQTSGNRFLGLHLLLPVAGRGGAAGGPAPPAGIRVHPGHPAWREGTPAIGAFVEATIPGGRRQIRQVDGGNGHSGQRSPEVRFGLGKTAGERIAVRITWRDLQGRLHHDSLSLAPGYHTVVLAGAGGTTS
jgi:enediyne biosynthesis protein E4